jgi:hypothetical protein
MYGGQILVESIPNKETKFTILIPEYKWQVIHLEKFLE